MAGLGVRHWQVVLIFWGLSATYALRVNLSVAVVAMTDSASVNPDIPEYDWSEKTKALLLSSFFWGYVVTQVPAGQLAKKFGGKVMFLSGIIICSLLTILTPLCAKLGGWQSMCALRVACGLCQGVVFPSVHTILSKWMLPSERATLGTCAYAGNAFGTIIMLAPSGLMAASSAGWPSIFYVSGAYGLIWAIVYFICGASSPSQYKRITLEEGSLIEMAQAGQVSSTELRTPWLRFFTSPPFLVLIVSHSVFNWGFWTLLTQIPSYMKSVLGKDIKSNALLSSLPYVCMFFMSFVFSTMSAQLDNRKCVSTGTSRKLFNTIGLWIPMITIVGLGYVRADQSTLAVVLLCFTVGMSGATYLGFNMNHLDLSPNFAGILMGITNCVANIMSIIAPLVVGLVVTNEKDQDQWRIVFFIAAGFFLVGNGLFVIFGKAEVQPWNDAPPKTPDVEPHNN